ncbi:ubiquinone biosynthesis accessory factor UbiJ [Actimicrobium sp. GrIS 1.19]|uniref:ubiquinone biosynthesis accessory factor UbiJ n=1 Tax=Actimicrobium sp. GrIS 1.19 TaxID=3071708 RepID=UPI002E0EBD07
MMTFSPLPPVLPAAINHLLAPEAWARARLIGHSGKIARFDLGVVAFAVQVEPDGLVRNADAETPPQVTIRINPAQLPLILQNRERAFSYVTIEGDADFANTISQLSQSLRWDAEADLARIVGAIAAVRLVAGAKAVKETITSTGQKLAETAAEYFLEENPMLKRPQSVRDFATDVARLRDDVERMAKRVERLKGKLQ